MPKLSVVIPSYNNADFIEATVRSVLEQDFGDFELIVADHSSTDGTLDRLAVFDDPRLTITTTPTGGGAPRNWNAVTDLATGEYLKLVCGDDVLLPGVLSQQVAALDAHPSAGVVASRRHIVDAVGELLIRDRGLTGLSGLVPGADAVRATVRSGTNLFGEPACVTLRRDLLVAAGGWDPRFPYFIDEASYVRVLLGADLVALPDAGAQFRISATQWSVALAASQASQAAEFHDSLHRSHPDVVRASDARRGNVLARVLAIARRLVYVRYAKRMRVPA